MSYKFKSLLSKLKTFDNLKSELLNYLINGNVKSAQNIYKSIIVKFRNNPNYSIKIKALKKNLKKNFKFKA